MEELLKEVKEIYPEAVIHKKKPTGLISEVMQNVIRLDDLVIWEYEDKICLSIYEPRITLCYMGVLGISKDKNKILNVLKAIKECEDENIERRRI